MDRFKFRVWNAELGSFYRGKQSLSIWEVPHPDKSYTIEQCTGLKDRNGTLIYEGDVLQVYDWGVERNDVLGLTPVIWDVDEKGWRYRDFLGAEDVYDQFRNVQIVGNIHENPELLK